MEMNSVKELAMQLIDRLPEGVSWEEVIYVLAMCYEIEKGIERVETNRANECKDIGRTLLLEANILD